MSHITGKMKQRLTVIVAGFDISAGLNKELDIVYILANDSLV